MRSRRVLGAIALVLIAAALLTGGRMLLDAGWGAALRSLADRLLPLPEMTVYAPAPEPGSHVSSYADATGAGTNYVYLVNAADANGVTHELQLIFFGGESSGSGWLRIEARGGSGVRYSPCAAEDVPIAARGACAPQGTLPV